MRVDIVPVVGLKRQVRKIYCVSFMPSFPIVCCLLHVVLKRRSTENLATSACMDRCYQIHTIGIPIYLRSYIEMCLLLTVSYSCCYCFQLLTGQIEELYLVRPIILSLFIYVVRATLLLHTLLLNARTLNLSTMKPQLLLLMLLLLIYESHLCDTSFWKKGDKICLIIQIK